MISSPSRATEGSPERGWPNGTWARKSHLMTTEAVVEPTPALWKWQQFLSRWGTTPTHFKLVAIGTSALTFSMLSTLPKEPAMFGSDWDFIGWIVGALSPLITLATVVAPVVAVAWPRTAWCLAASGVLFVVPMAISGLPVIGLATFVSWLSVALVTTWRSPGLALVIGACSLSIPIAMAIRIGMRLPSMEIFSDYWGASQRILVPVFWGLWIAIALWLARVLRRSITLRAAQTTLTTEAAGLANEASAVSERARVARDLHDVVAHRISLLAVRAETAPFTHPDLPDDAKLLLRQTADDARLALDEMRTVLGVLHRTSDGPSLSPQPRGADITTLVDESRAAGAKIVLDGELPDIDDVRGTTAYRVVQEALTNVRRHAPEATATLAIRCEPELIVIEVSNPHLGTLGSPGRGISGMRERVGLIGGTLDTRMAEGRYVLTARLPDVS